MLPKGFSTLLACEPHEVAQVVLEVLEQTIGYVGDNPHGRREWVALTYRHFEHKGLMSKDKAGDAITYALKAGYILRRPVKRRGRFGSYKYAIRWHDSENVPHQG
jgi:hypothetical protein